MKNVLAFDLSWAGKTGWARLDFRDDDKIPYDYETGEISPSSGKRKAETSGIYELRRVSTYIERLVIVLRENIVSPTIICFEDNRDWLLSASRRKQRNKPVTKASMYGMVVTIPCFLAAIDKLNKTKLVLDVVSVNNKAARNALDVSRYCDLDRKLYRQLESSNGYDGGVKASVGVAVTHILRNYGFGNAVLSSDHKADAMMIALYTSLLHLNNKDT